ncbi:MAG TPA: sugar phosphate isomerase/epimerase family protein [Feifaniaceae bacterium]|nr:sugar phosphate isomerase/epimerase family protein [Feifaniaceae bacterium]
MAKHSVILGNVGNFSDRYMGGGYQRDYTLTELFDRVKSIDGVTGVELVSNWHVTPENAKEVKAQLERTGLKLVSIIPDHFGTKKYGRGAFSSKDPAMRRVALEETKAIIDVAKFLGGDLISLWPGQDGYDYPFQGDYIEEHGWFIEGVRQCCLYRPDVKISIEYKPREPRNFSYPATAAMTLLMVKEIDEPNCGVTIDYGHGTAAKENVAESVAVIKRYGDRLFHIHMNDNYCMWDDDMITGSVHTIPFIEFFYWLKRTGYEGYISTDQYPYREDGRDACNESVRWFEVFEDLAGRIDEQELAAIYRSGNAVEVSAFLRRLMFNR